MNYKDQLKSIVTDLEERSITKHQAYELILTLFDVKKRLVSDLMRFEEMKDTKCFYSKQDKIKRVKLLIEAQDNLEDYLEDNS